MVLQVAAQKLLGQLHALRMGGAAGHGAGIDGEKVAPRRQHVLPSPRGRTRGAGCDPQPRQRAGQPGAFAVGAGAGGIDMQPLAEAAFLEVADKAVDQRDRLRGRRVGGQAKVGLKPGGAGLVTDREDQAVAAARVQPVGGGIFVQQAFQMRQTFGQSGLDQRRGQVSQRDRTQPALGLRRLAGVVDDEGIGDRQIAQ